MINNFDDKYEFLSNFYAADVLFDGILYPTNEHAFQAAKSMDPTVREKIRNLDTPGKAKREGRRLKLREDWEIIKLDVMYDIVKDKFSRHADLRNKLISTGNEELIEGNWWHDTFWGMCWEDINGTKIFTGKNNLGKILMRVRDELKTTCI